MKSSLFHDRRAAKLLSRVRDDIFHLRDDIANLLSHTSRQTLPGGAREIAGQVRESAHDLAGQARNRLAAGGSYAASRLRELRGQPPCQSAGWVRGALVVGLLGYAAYALYRHNAERRALEDEEALADGDI